MSHNKMLIDATHPEETRVVVLKDGRVEEFDYESASRKQLRGNIYLAKVTRVEPSLQAAFVEYGGNRHGFLAFSEIHPDYYQIPMADRQALLEEEALAAAEHAAEDDEDIELVSDDGAEFNGDGDNETDEFDDESDVVSSNDDDDDEDEDEDEDADSGDLVSASDDEPNGDGETVASATEDDEDSSGAAGSKSIALDAQSDDHRLVAQPEPANGDDESDRDSSFGSADEDQDEDIGTETTADGDDIQPSDAPDDDDENSSALDDEVVRPRRRRRHYKIQEVIKRRQVILIQVVKEERGNKGAALTTYLSLAGRYTVLMPNTARGGGISRKITNPQDRKRLKVIANELDVPEGMGLIVRTAGASRTKQELRRDFEYLLRLWESVRDLTLKSSAPSLVYEEGNLIKRSIRDLYNKELDEVIVAGEAAHKQAKEFMRMLMPSHAKNVVLHQKSESLFTTYGIERQLNAMFSPQVTLRSGGYLIINQTEALVAVDVNSGKATREFSIEETALATNLEAASEIARQLKLRDLAGLIVIDFIDMDERRNNRAVERRLKDALRHDRARIQFGRISHFGLLEMSRQRLRTGVLEGSTSQCPHCQGTGIIRSTDSVALAVLRAIEDAVVSGEPASIVATTSAEAAIYILNNKRSFINEIEQRHGITVRVEASDKMQGANFTVGKVVNGDASASAENRTVVNMDWGFEPDPAEARSGQPSRRRGRGRGRGRVRDDDAHASSDDQKPRRRRRRRGRRSDRNGDDDQLESQVQEAQDDDGSSAIPGDGPQPDLQAAEDSSGEARDDNTPDSGQDDDGNGQRRPRRRRGRRGGNRERRGRGGRRGEARDGDDPNGQSNEQPEQADSNARGGDGESASDRTTPDPEPAAADKPKHDAPSPAPSAEQDGTSAVDRDATPKPRRRSTESSKPKHEHVLVTPGGDDGQGDRPGGEVADDASEGTKRGWWSRRLGRS